jgi:hypothetical protein
MISSNARKEALMPFELIMLLGFFGTALLGLLPVEPAREAGESFRGRRQKHSDRKWRNVARSRRVMRRDQMIRPRVAGRVAA